MRISVNLATRPFVELRPLFQRLRIIMAALGVLAIVLAILLHSETKKANAQQAQMQALVQKTHSFQQERANNEARMQQPTNAAVLTRAQFLNALFVRKSPTSNRRRFPTAASPSASASAATATAPSTSSRISNARSASSPRALPANPRKRRTRISATTARPST